MNRILFPLYAVDEEPEKSTLILGFLAWATNGWWCLSLGKMMYKEDQLLFEEVLGTNETSR